MLAILRSVPKSLAKLGLPREQTRRLWTTALAAATMESLEIAWATSGVGYYGQGAVGEGSVPETLLDRADAWLSAQPLPAEVMEHVRRAAARRVAEWRTVQDQKITAMRAAELSTVSHALTIFERTVGAVARAMLSTHQTLSVFIAPYLDASACRVACATMQPALTRVLHRAVRRWQCFIALISTLLSVLVRLCCCLRLECSALTRPPRRRW